MFTGIIEAIGKVVAFESRRRLTIASDLPLQLGDSISINGVCLTVSTFDDGGFVVDLSEETVRRSALGDLAPAYPVNLERPLAAGGRLGGHIVQGHVDGVGRVLELRHLEGSVEIWFETPRDLRRYLVEKGSVAVDGVSLTIFGLKDDRFAVSLIPHTLRSTTFGEKKPGDRVNIEVDVLAKYVEQLAGPYSRKEDD